MGHFGKAESNREALTPHGIYGSSMKAAISNVERTGTSRLQPCYFEEDRWVGLEGLDCEWLRVKPANWTEGEFVRLECRWLKVMRIKSEMDAAWRKDAERRLAAVTEEIEIDKVLAKLESERAADQARCQAEDQKYFDELLVLIKRRHID